MNENLDGHNQLCHIIIISYLCEVMLCKIPTIKAAVRAQVL